MKIFKFLLISTIKIYQLCISPLIGPRCRFHPTCSCYAIEAINKYGPIKGTLLACWRILRCNPLNKKYGHDPLK